MATFNLAERLSDGEKINKTVLISGSAVVEENDIDYAAMLQIQYEINGSHLGHALFFRDGSYMINTLDDSIPYSDEVRQQVFNLMAQEGLGEIFNNAGVELTQTQSGNVSEPIEGNPNLFTSSIEYVKSNNIETYAEPVTGIDSGQHL